jgi:hypothetical protein
MSRDDLRVVVSWAAAGSAGTYFLGGYGVVLTILLIAASSYLLSPFGRKAGWERPSTCPHPPTEFCTCGLPPRGTRSDG